MLKRVKKLVKGHKKIKDKNVNTLSFQITDHSSSDCGQDRNANTNTTTPGFLITDHSSDYESQNKTQDKIIIPPTIQITDHSSDYNEDNDNNNDNTNDNNNNNNNNENTDNRLASTNNNRVLKNQRCASSGVLSEKSKKGSSKEKIKKRKSSQQLQLSPEGLRQVSKSTGDLTHLLSPNRCASQSFLGSEKSSGHSSRRGSVETVRENRLSVISKLDEYIDHFKKSVDEDKIAYAPNRLCCAQILLKVYQKREQQYIYNSLHLNRNSQPAPRRASHGQQHLLSPTSGSFHNLNNTSSTPNFAQGQHRRVSGQQGSESNTSLSDDSKECNFRIGGGCDTSDSDSDGHENNNNHSTGSNATDIDYSNNNRLGNSLGILKSNMRQRSVPLFPHINQDIDIF